MSEIESRRGPIRSKATIRARNGAARSGGLSPVMPQRVEVMCSRLVSRTAALGAILRYLDPTRNSTRLRVANAIVVASATRAESASPRAELRVLRAQRREVAVPIGSERNGFAIDQRAIDGQGSRHFRDPRQPIGEVGPMSGPQGDAGPLPCGDQTAGGTSSAEAARKVAAVGSFTASLARFWPIEASDRHSRTAETRPQAACAASVDSACPQIEPGHYETTSAFD